MHKLNLERVTGIKDDSRVKINAMYLAPEQILFGLAYNDNVEVDRRMSLL